MTELSVERCYEMKPSKYNFFVQTNDAVYAVNLLSRAAITLSLEAYQTYTSIIQGTRDLPNGTDFKEFIGMLQHNMFLIDDEFDEIAYIRHRVQQERYDARQLGLVITPTMGCNFGCHYCFENTRDTTLSPTVQKKILKLVASKIVGREHLSVQWFGGEPLQALDVIEDLSRKLMRITDAAGAQYAATVITNGFLLTEEVAQLLQELGVMSVQITLDGDRSLHNRTRYERPGEGSFDVILDNIRRASPYLMVKVRVHVAPFSIQSVENLIDTLGNEGMASHIGELYFAPLFNYRVGMESPAYLPDGRRFMSSQDFANEQVNLHEKAHRWGFKLPDMLDVSFGICTALRDNTLVIDTNGNLMKCYKDVDVPLEAIGTLDAGVRANQNLVKWMDIDIPRDDECRACQFLPVCLGGCTKQWHENASKSVICTPLKFNAEARIQQYFENEEWQKSHQPNQMDCSA